MQGYVNHESVVVLTGKGTLHGLVLGGQTIKQWFVVVLGELFLIYLGFEQLQKLYGFNEHRRFTFAKNKFQNWCQRRAERIPTVYPFPPQLYDWDACLEVCVIVIDRENAKKLNKQNALLMTALIKGGLNVANVELVQA